MTVQKPTNADILKEIKDLGTRLTEIERWKLTTIAAQKAVDEYRKQEEAARVSRISQTTQTEWTKVAKQVGVIAGILIAIFYAYLNTKGIKP